MGDKRAIFPVKPGDKFARRAGVAGTMKIMAVADGYAMARFPHCIPFVIYLKDLCDGTMWLPLPHSDARAVR